MEGIETMKRGRLPVILLEISSETAPQTAKPVNQPQRPAIDLEKFRKEIGIDISNISDEELLDLIE